MIFHSSTPMVDIPEVSWSRYFFQAMAPYHEQPALIDGITGRVINFDELKQTIKTVALALQKRGYKKGDIFAIYAPNSTDFVIAFHAVIMAGGVVTTVNPLYTANELTHQLHHAGAVCLMTVPELLDKANTAIVSSTVREVYCFGTADEGCQAFSTLMQEQDTREFDEIAIKPAEDIAVLPYSSGTTGLAKGVMLSHRNLVAHNLQMESMFKTSIPNEQDRVIAVLPFFHIYGMTIIMNYSLCKGAVLVIMRNFDVQQFLHLIQQYRITRAYLAPPIIIMLAKHPLVEQYDVSSLNYIVSGAAPLGEDQALAVKNRIACPVYQAYGMTEMSPATHIFPDQCGSYKAASIGVPTPGTEAMIVDLSNGTPLTFNQTGELLVRGPQMMLGYLNDSQATADTIDEDGWLHTGDIAYVDQEGFFYIVDRVKELIKYKGYQVAPAELEALLLTHPAIADAAVIPIPEEEAGEIPKAFIVLKQDIGAEAIMSWVAEQVAPYKKIREIEFIQEIPKSPSGKILRRKLKTAAEQTE